MNSLSAQWSNWMTRLSHWFKHLIVGWLLKLMGKEEGINKLVTGRFRLFCTPIIADILLTEFDDIAPEPEIIASYKMFALKWNFFRAAQSLIKCKPEAVALILNQWHQNPKFKNHAFKAQVIPQVMLIAPPFAPEIDKVVSIVDLIAMSNKPLIENMLKTMFFDSVIAYVGRTKLPPLNATLAALPMETLVPIFYGLKANYPAAFNDRIGKLPPATSGQIRAKIREIDEHQLRIQEHGMKVKNFEKTDTLLERLIPPPPDQLPSPEGSDKK
jgi:hypothetical protein